MPPKKVVPPKKDDFTVPVYASLATEKRMLVKQMTQKEQMEWKDPGGDLLDALYSMMTQPGVRQRIMDEFEAESTVKNEGVSRVKVNGKVYDMIFNKKQITYGSWTLSGVVKQYVDVRLDTDEKYLFDVEEMASNRKCDYVLKAAFTAYIAHNRKGVIKKYAKQDVLFKKMYEIVQAYQQAVYGWDEDEERFGVALSAQIYIAYPNFDANLLMKFVEFVMTTSAYKSWGNTRKDEVIGNIKSDIKWRPVDQLKVDRIKKKGQASTMKILRPEQIAEVDFREMVRKMCEVVFKDTEKWDEIVIDPDDKEQLNTALCLLMLGIGSRARGIIMVNQIEALDYDIMRGEPEHKPVEVEEKTKKGSKKKGKKEEKKVVPVEDEVEKEDESIVEMRRQLMARTVGYGTMRVKRLTKEKREGKQVEDKIKESKAFAEKELTTDEAKDLVAIDRSIHMIDKPFLYMLFSRYEMQIDKKGVKDEELARQRPRDVFIQLLKAVRDVIKRWSEEKEGKKMKYTVDWESYQTLDRKIYMIKETQTDKKSVEKFMKSVWVGMNKTCIEWLGMIPHLKEKNPHQLRRMYVCYSYEYFGRDISKEIGYAQYVLRHTNIATSMLYTTMSFKMALSDSMADDKDFKSEFVKSVVDIRGMLDEINVLKKMLTDVTTHTTQPNKRKMVVDFVDVMGDPVVGFKKMKRAPNGATREWMIDRAKEQVKKMHDAGIELTRVNLTKAGINTNIVLEVMELVKTKGIGIVEDESLTGS